PPCRARWRGDPVGPVRAGGLPRSGQPCRARAGDLGPRGARRAGAGVMRALGATAVGVLLLPMVLVGAAVGGLGGLAAGSATPSATDPRDAVFAAAAKLAADGAARDPLAALRAYDPAPGYPATVVAWALAYGWEPGDVAVLASAVFTHPHIGLRPEAAA